MDGDGCVRFDESRALSVLLVALSVCGIELTHAAAAIQAGRVTIYDGIRQTDRDRGRARRRLWFTN